MRISSWFRCAPFVALVVGAWAVPVGGQVFVSRGPVGVTGGQVEGNSPGTMFLQNRPVNGAVETLLPHPTNPDVLYAGTINGGVWRTSNATATNPTWTPLTDRLSSLSMGSLAFDRADPTYGTVWAGNGLYSSFGRRGGARAGLMFSADAGATWQRPAQAGFSGSGVRGIVVDGPSLVVATDFSDANTYATIGIFRSTDGGASFTQISNGAGSGLPNGRAYELAQDPTNPAVLYTAVGFAVEGSGGTNGVYRSADFGATWSLVSGTSGALFTNFSNSGTLSRARISVGNSGQVFVGTVVNGRAAGVYRSATGLAGSWVTLDTPSTNEGSVNVGLNPRPFDPNRGLVDEPNGVPQSEEGGGQGSIHFSLAADPGNANLVYVGGDRQPLLNEGQSGASFPNSLGAFNYSGRLFRVDASLPAGSQASSLTHVVGVSTTDNSAPHADSRDMKFLANGVLAQGDDGGVYRRSNPAGLGAWSGLAGNIQNTEIHSVAYDRLSGVIFGGTQDCGTVEQVVSDGGVQWRTVNQGDGGQVAVHVPAAGNSVRYTSSQFLGGFRRRTMSAANAQVSSSFPALQVTGAGVSFYTLESGTIPFYTPIATNPLNGNLYIGARRVYESTDGGTTLNNLLDLGSGGQVTALWAGAENNPDAFFVGTNRSANPLYRRTSAGGPLTSVAGYLSVAGAGTVVALAGDATDFNVLAVLDSNQVLLTLDGGNNFADITGNLLAGGRFSPLSVAVANGVFGDIYFVGLRSGGVWATGGRGVLGNWVSFGDLPNAPVFDMQYDQAVDLLVVTLLGRGTFTFSNARVPVIPEPAMLGLVVAGGLLLGRSRRV
jgi:hypothetical protein